MVQGIGASTSGLVAGLIVDHFGYSAAFLEAAATAGIAFGVLAVLMPETAYDARSSSTRMRIHSPKTGCLWERQCSLRSSVQQNVAYQAPCRRVDPASRPRSTTICTGRIEEMLRETDRCPSKTGPILMDRFLDPRGSPEARRVPGPSDG
jgi:hypothetical protein